MKKPNKIWPVLLAFVLLFTQCAPVLAAESGDAILIKTVEDWNEFAQNCYLDTWSQGKVVKLAADLDLTGAAATSIPTFGGFFDGQGHQITGLSITGSGGVLGLFRYLQPGGQVTDITVKGNVTPTGSKDTIGGIVGSNSGKLTQCNFEGTVKGKNIVGGLVGINEAEGQIINSSFSGKVTGEHYVGGVAGQNLGSLILCKNLGSINTTEVETSLEVDQINWQKLNSTENTPASSDIGGITGYSTSVIQSCGNLGKVGYEHMGYNVGGIAGRQSGYLDGCKNSGEVYGRKDVGGIVGQAEPNITLNYNKSTLQEMVDALNNLNHMANRTIQDTGNLSDNVSAQITNLSNSTTQAKDAAHDMADQMTDWGEENIDTVNDASARISWALNELDPVLTDTQDSLNAMASTAGGLSSAMSDGQILSDLGADALEELKGAFEHLTQANDTAKAAVEHIQLAKDHLKNSLGNPAEMEAAKTELVEGIRELSTAMGNISQAISEIHTILTASPSFDDAAFKQALENLIQGFRARSEALKGMAETVKNVNFDFDEERFKAAMQEVGNAVTGLLESQDQVSHSFTDLKNAASVLAGARDTAKSIFEHLEDAGGQMEEGAFTLSDAMGKLKSIVGDLADKPSIEFSKLSSAFTNQSEAFKQSLGETLDGVEELNQILSNSTDAVKNDMLAINQQVSVVMDLMQEMLNDSKEPEPEDYYQDISEENLNSDSTTGKIFRSENAGKIEGDVNVGGITGSMAIEYDFDPEDDLTTQGNRSLDFQYQANAVIHSCKNRGMVRSKKNYAGGIVGRMDMGAVFSCEGYGLVESTDGDYVGGIAGSSSSVIKDSWAKCRLSGADYIGGIAGFGDSIKDCHSLIELAEGSEFLGAIAGDVESLDNISQNTFVHQSMAGIDSVSYTGKAEPMLFEQLLSESQTPKAFQNFSLIFIADGNVISEIPFAYGDSVDPNSLPKVPEKEGYSAKWPAIPLGQLTFSHSLEAVYTPYSSALSCENEGVPNILASGTFSVDAKMEVQTQEVPPLDGQTANPATAYTVNLTDPILGERPYTIRFHLPNRDKNYTLWVQTEGQWRKQGYERDGSYLLVNSPVMQTTFCVVEQESNVLHIIKMIGIIAGGVAVLVTIILWTKKKLKRKAVSKKKH